MIHSYVRRGASLRVSWLIHSYTANRLFMPTSSHSLIHVCCESGIHMLDISTRVKSHSCTYWDFFMNVCHDSFIHLCVPWLVLSYMGHLAFVHDHDSPLTEEIRLKMFGFTDVPDCRVDLLSDGDSVYSRETLFEKFGDSRENMFICTGTLVRTCWKFRQS